MIKSAGCEVAVYKIVHIYNNLRLQPYYVITANLLDSKKLNGNGFPVAICRAEDWATITHHKPLSLKYINADGEDDSFDVYEGAELEWSANLVEEAEAKRLYALFEKYHAEKK